MATEVVGQVKVEGEPAAKVKKPRRSFSVSLQGADGATLRIGASLKKDGSAVTHAVHKQKGQKGGTRGATERHANADAARAAVEKLVAAAVKLGWTRKVGVGFRPRPDSFDAAHLPTPGKPKK